MLHRVWAYMATYTVGVIGTGAAPGGTEQTGYAMGYRHAEAFAALDNCEVAACADLVEDHAQRFASEFDIDEENVFADYREMLSAVDLDVVSVTTPIPTHAPIVIDVANRSDVSAIHCEKPMADTWGDSRLMAQECDRQDVQLTFNHQLRFDGPTEVAKELLDEGRIGELERVEASRRDLFESGTHQMDICSYMAGDVPGAWVLGNVDYREAELAHGVHIEDQALGLWKYRNGVYGLASTGDGEDAIGCHVRLRGTGGTIEIRFFGEEKVVVYTGGDREVVECPSPPRIQGVAADLIACLETGEEPRTSANNTMVATEIMYSIYESSRRRGRVDLPLRVPDNPLIDMLETGALQPAGLDTVTDRTVPE